MAKLCAMSCNLTIMRKRLGMTQRQVAALFEQTSANVSHYERGKQELPPRLARRLIEAAGAMGVDLSFDDIYGKVSHGDAPENVREAA